MAIASFAACNFGPKWSFAARGGESEENSGTKIKFYVMIITMKRANGINGIETRTEGHSMAENRNVYI